MPRLTIDLGLKTDSTLSDLSKSQGISKSEVLRRAVSVFMYLQSQTAQGNSVEVRDKEGRLVKEIVFY